MTDTVPPQVQSLRHLFPWAQFTGCHDITVRSICGDSRDVQAGTLFALKPRAEGVEESFCQQAVAKGAAALLVERRLPHLPVPQCIVPDVPQAYAQVCAALAGHPASQVHLAGVTGTNGKTTVTWMLRAILQVPGRRVGLLGTIEYSDGVHHESAKLTTPDALTLQQWLWKMRANGVRHAAMEVSSHALDQGRVAGIPFESVTVTNVTQDHLDYHGTLKAYWAAKARLLNLVRPDGLVVLSRQQELSWSMRSLVPAGVAVAGCGWDALSDIRAEIQQETLRETLFRLHVYGMSVDCRLPIVGRHNLENAMTAAAIAYHHGATLEQIAAALEHFPGVPGRMQRVDEGQDFAVLVDYAHTDDALRRGLAALQPITMGRLICVFGAGGNRDRLKRPLMGAAAAEADIVILTSDNPRSEDPGQIVAEIQSGIPADGPEVFVELDRAEAIRLALTLAETGDTVFIAGKGHEGEQVVQGRRIPFDDRLMAHAWLQLLLSRPEFSGRMRESTLEPLVV